MRAAIAALSPKDFENAQSRVISHQAGFAKLEQTAAQYLDSFAIPNLWFHISTAYLLLRANGVDVGKGDFDGLHSYPNGFTWIET